MSDDRIVSTHGRAGVKRNTKSQFQVLGLGGDAIVYYDDPFLDDPFTGKTVIKVHGDNDFSDDRDSLSENFFTDSNIAYEMFGTIRKNTRTNDSSLALSLSYFNDFNTYIHIHESAHSTIDSNAWHNSIQTYEIIADMDVFTDGSGAAVKTELDSVNAGVFLYQDSYFQGYLVPHNDSAFTFTPFRTAADSNYYFAESNFTTHLELAFLEDSTDSARFSYMKSYSERQGLILTIADGITDARETVIAALAVESGLVASQLNPPPLVSTGGGGADQAELDSANQLITQLRSNLDDTAEGWS